MNIVQITPGAGAMYCGNCFRDNALVAELRRAGHHALMVPMYLPLRLDGEDQSAGTPIFFSGVNVYLDQKFAWFRTAPAWLHRWLASPRLLQWASGRAARTRASDVADLTISMMRGEEGNQARELDDLVAWLKTQEHPGVVCLSNALLIGMARGLKRGLRTAVVCMLQGEDSFLDALPDSHRGLAWQTMAQRAADVDLFVAPSQYFKERMCSRLALAPERVQVIFNGIDPDTFEARPLPSAARPPDAPVLGYFARMCREKGLDTLIAAFVLLKQRNRVPGLRLRVGGGCGPADEPFVAALREQLRAASVLDHAEFCPNVDHAAKVELLRSFDVMSVPARYGEAFGLYLLEAWASGVPVVQPRHAAFPELIEASGAGVVCEPDNPQSLAEAVESLLLDTGRCRTLAERGLQSARDQFNVQSMSRTLLGAFDKLLSSRAAPAHTPGP